MSRISVWFVRTALLHFAVGATAGAWQLTARSGIRAVAPLLLRGVHVELVLLGWVTQLALGVALWILPFSRGVDRDPSVWVAWGTLNLGIAMVVGAKLGNLALFVLGGRALEVAAVLLVMWRLWGRVRGVPRRG